MQCYAAPMEGITGYVYRNVHAKHYKGIDKYFTPFLTPKIKRVWTTKEMNDILPEHNKNVNLVPQILTNKASDLVFGAEDLFQRGYQEVNLNLGCPSGTVFSKGRGSGFLKEPEKLKLFFDEYFRTCKVPLSVKTRLGVADAAEFDAILAVFAQFPFTEVIIHTRVREDYYKIPAKPDAFALAYERQDHPLCYNGDLYRISDVEKLLQQYPSQQRVMIGRGMLANPQLAEQIKSGGVQDLKRLKAFLDDICAGYEEVLSGNKNALYKLKELWFYLAWEFSCIDKYEKKIKKSKNLIEYRAVVDALFAEETARRSDMMGGNK